MCQWRYASIHETEMFVMIEIPASVAKTWATLSQPLVMMWSMNDFHTDALSIECGTCVATGTTACTDCVVTHLLANDDGPIGLVSVAVAAPLSVHDRAIALFERAGLLDDPIEFVDFATFEDGLVTATFAVP